MPDRVARGAPGLTAVIVLGVAAAAAGPQMKPVEFEGMRFSVPAACNLQAGRDGDVARATCQWNDGTARTILALKHMSAGGFGFMTGDARSTAVQNLCRFLAETELRTAPSACRSANIRLSNVATANLPQGTEACAIGTGDADFADGKVAHRRLILCHLAAPDDRSTAVMVQVVGLAPKAAFDQLSKQVVESLAIRPQV